MIGPQVGMWTVLLVSYLTVQQGRLLTVLRLHKMVSTDWGASRWRKMDYSQAYSWSSLDGILFSCGSCCGNLGNYASQQNCGSHGSRGSHGSCRSRGSQGQQERQRSRVSLGSCRSQRNRESRSICGSRGRGGSRWSQGRRRSYRSRRCSGSWRYCESQERCQRRCGRRKKIEHCQGLRSCDSGCIPAFEHAVVECMRFEQVETKLRDCLPPESLGKRTQQHLRPLILDHHATLGDYSTYVVVRAEERLHGLCTVLASELGAEIVEIMTGVDGIPGSNVGQLKRVQYLQPELSLISIHVSVHHENRV
jgi:hypothetical protein